MTLYQTDDMEKSIRRMSRSNNTTLVYSQTRAVRPIRLRLNLLHDIPMAVAWAYKPTAELVIEQWQKEGGTLIFKPWQHGNKHLPPATDAQFFIECPMQTDAFEKMIPNVRKEIVIYRPPSWEMHDEYMDYLYPNANTYRILDSIFVSLIDRELTPVQEGLNTLVTFPNRVVFNMSELIAWTGWTKRYIRTVMNMYRRVYGRWHMYRARMAPTDPDMLEAYNLLCAQGDVGFGTYGLRFEMLAQGKTPGFSKMLKRLLKEKYVSVEDTIFVVKIDKRPLDYDKIDAINNMRRWRWGKMRDMVDNAPRY